MSANRELAAAASEATEDVVGKVSLGLEDIPKKTGVVAKESAEETAQTFGEKLTEELGALEDKFRLIELGIEIDDGSAVRELEALRVKAQKLFAETGDSSVLIQVAEMQLEILEHLETVVDKARDVSADITTLGDKAAKQQRETGTFDYDENQAAELQQRTDDAVFAAQDAFQETGDEKYLEEAEQTQSAWDSFKEKFNADTKEMSGYGSAQCPDVC